MNTKLQVYFPMLRSRRNILEEIYGNEELKKIFNSWDKKYQEEFLNFCTSAKGGKILYDFCVKEVLSPEVHPERLEELISLLLQKKVKILLVLPNDGTRLAGDSSLLVMDFVVELEDGSIANVEIQKVGYAFPGQRVSCYSADLLLRQYRQVRNRTKKEDFSYRQISKVYTIVFFEKSTSEFHRFPEHYIHKFEHSSDTGLKMNFLQEFVFVALDIYRENHHNKDSNGRLEGWLAFLSSDKSEDIIALIEKYPDFKPMYEQIYEICQNMEKVMGMFSKELQILDRNTVKYMIDELQEENQRQKEENQRQKEENQRQREENQRQKEENQRQREELESRDKTIDAQREELERLKSELEAVWSSGSKNI